MEGVSLPPLNSGPGARHTGASETPAPRRSSVETLSRHSSLAELSLESPQARHGSEVTRTMADVLAQRADSRHALLEATREVSPLPSSRSGLALLGIDEEGTDDLVGDGQPPESERWTRLERAAVAALQVLVHQNGMCCGLCWRRAVAHPRGRPESHRTGAGGRTRVSRRRIWMRGRV
jgi:hypothetical protein